MLEFKRHIITKHKNYHAMKTTYIIFTIASMLFFTNIITANTQNDARLYLQEDENQIIYQGPAHNFDGDNLHTEKKKPAQGKATFLDSSIPTPNAETEFDYLKFDVTKYINENEEAEYIELPESNLSYLRFDVNEMEQLNPVGLDEMPENEFKHLEFKVEKFYSTGKLNNESFGELPE